MIDFPVVGVGASAGGYEAVSELLAEVPANLEVAIVVIQHLDPRHDSLLSELLGRRSRMPVTVVSNGMRVERGRVHVMPPNTGMTIAGGLLKFHPRANDGRPPMPIDVFLRSLADDCHERAIGVVLSGTASDGALGIRAIKAVGGVTFAEEPSVALHDSMPRHAIATGAVDFVMPPAGIARELSRIAAHPYFAADFSPLAATGRDDEALAQIFQLVRSETGVDFAEYRPPTIRRRIARRMVLHRLDTVERYLHHIEQHPDELPALYNDLLINVTGFFRDPRAFEVLQREVFPGILAARQGDAPARAWTPGCATGEETYSLAIGLLEAAGQSAAPVQVFGTDVSEVAVAKARVGIYPENISVDVSPERLRRFFSRVDGQYRIKKTVRDLCVFARHNVAKDPPFSRMDLITCRNVLIYLDAAVQKRLMATFHYALSSTGYLMLGKSESIGPPLSDLFVPVDTTHKLYAKRPTTTHFVMPRTRERDTERLTLADTVRTKSDATPRGELLREVDRVMLAHYAPPGVVINEALEILQFRGHTSPYLEPAPGHASLNVLKMAREGLLGALKSAIEQARKGSAAVRREGVRVHHRRGRIDVSIQVVPVVGRDRERNYLVLFEEAAPTRAPRGRPRAVGREAGVGKRVEHLRQELATTKEFLQSIIEQREAVNEELRSTNEELQSSNEELQSTNEELETAKEELESVNEELTTVNEELQHRNEELSQATADFNNLFTSVNLPVIMLTRDLRIRRFTPPAMPLFNLSPIDIGRPIAELRVSLLVDGLAEACAETLDSATPSEREVRDREGRWYSLRLRPYRAQEGDIEGVVIALVDVTALKTGAEQATAARDDADAIVNTLPTPLLVLDRDLRVRAASRAFHEVFSLASSETVNRFLGDVGAGEWDVPALRQALEGVLERGETFDAFELEQEDRGVGLRTFELAARPIQWGREGERMVLLAILEVTARKHGERQLRASEELRYRRLFETAKDGIVILDGDTGQITKVNPSWTALVGYTPEDLLGKKLWEIQPLHEAEHVARALVRELYARESVRYDNVTIRTRDGRRLSVELTCNAYPIAGRPVVQCVARDVTDRVQFAERQEAARIEAEKANRAKDEFLSVLSHELRTPLTAMLGWTRMLKSGSLDPDKTQHALETIERNTRLQAQLIEDLLDVSRIRAGKMRVDLRPVDLVGVVEATVETVRPSAEARGLRLETRLDAVTGLVLGDRFRLQQVIWNLLSNAVKFTPPGGDVAIHLTATGGWARLSVIDSGRGIPADVLPYIFERFRQGESAFTRTEGGLGLGLSIVHDLVELHGGRVKAESGGEGRGATFTVELPLASPDAVAVGRDTDDGVNVGIRRDRFIETEASLEGTRALLVENDVDTRDLIAAVLRNAGVRVVPVETAAEALVALAGASFDVLISDIGLPREDGYALIRRVRALPADQGGRTPAVALTAFAADDDRQRALDAGYSVHVPKPVDPADLLAVIAVAVTPA